jgi:hypothetical protein
MYVPETSWWQLSGSGKPSSNGNGFGDITAFVKGLRLRGRSRRA